MNSVVTEKANIDDIISSLEKGFGDTDDSKSKILQLFKGIIFSDDPKAKEFMKALDKFTTIQSRKMQEDIKKNVIDLVLKKEIKINNHIFNKGSKISIKEVSFKEEKMPVFPNSRYFMGASSNPDKVLITKVDQNLIYYKKYPYNGKELRVEKSIGIDLIQQAMDRVYPFVKKYDVYGGISKEDFDNYYRGRPLNNYDPKNYIFYSEVEIEVTEDDKKRDMLYKTYNSYDAYNFGEKFGMAYGSTQNPLFVGMNDVNENSLEELKSLEKQGYLKIIKIKK